MTCRMKRMVRYLQSWLISAFDDNRESWHWVHWERCWLWKKLMSECIIYESSKNGLTDKKLSAPLSTCVKWSLGPSRTTSRGCSTLGCWRSQARITQGNIVKYNNEWPAVEREERMQRQHCRRRWLGFKLRRYPNGTEVLLIFYKYLECIIIVSSAFKVNFIA